MMSFAIDMGFCESYIGEGGRKSMPGFRNMDQFTGIRMRSCPPTYPLHIAPSLLAPKPTVCESIISVVGVPHRSASWNWSWFWLLRKAAEPTRTSARTVVRKESSENTEVKLSTPLTLIVERLIAALLCSLYFGNEARPVPEDDLIVLSS